MSLQTQPSSSTLLCFETFLFWWFRILAQLHFIQYKLLLRLFFFFFFFFLLACLTRPIRLPQRLGP